MNLSLDILRICDAMRQDGPSSLYILTDFDRTLTYGTIDGKKTPSIVSLLRDGKHLREDYAVRAHALFDHYYPLETSPTLTIDQKKPLMSEWWRKHFELMIECGLTRADITDVINGSHLRLRSSVDQVLQMCRVSDIPVAIMSAGACGEAIPLFLEGQGVDFSNIHYACNQFIWDENGHAIGIHEPIIHTFNKDETSIERFPDIYDRIRNRPNVILIGDSLGDIGMVEGFPYRHLLKIGFLEGGDAISRAPYEAHFDIVIDGDGDFGFVKECLERILT